MKKAYPGHYVKQFTDLRDLAKTSAEAFGDKDLYTYKRHEENVVVTYNQFYDYVRCLGTAFHKLGFAESTVVMTGENHPAYSVTYIATIAAGGVIVPLDKDIKDDEMPAFISKCRTRAVFFTNAMFDKIVPMFEKLSAVEMFVCIDFDKEERPNDPRFKTFDEIIEVGKAALEEGDTSFDDYEFDMSKLAAIIFTSGTTGTSKGVMLSHYNLVKATLASDSMIAYDDTTSFVSVLPMHHTYEMTCAHLGTINLGASTFFNDGIKYTMRNLSAVKPNAMVFVPLYVETIYKRIFDELEKKGMANKVRALMKMSDGMRKIGIDTRRKLFKPILEALGGRLESIICGGAPLPRKIMEDFESLGITILEGYGITECAPLVSCNTFGWKKFGSVGLPVPGCEVKIDKADGEETGEILVKGPNVMMGYYEDPEATAAVFTEDGWFRTGDIGYIDEDGFIYITGRKKNIILLSNGKNIFPEELEEYLVHCSSVSEVVVIGRKDDKGETKITAVVYPNKENITGESDDEIYAAVKADVDALNKTLPVFKHITDIEIRAEEFEKTTSRKIKRYKVK
ncbi:MAG: AMP-binding protein [Clostridia bacterium]|nr:AMP-binding protein [Clostridia bacterium]